MNPSAGILQPAIEQAFTLLHQGREDFTAKLTPHEVGIVTKVSTGIATFSGLPSVGYEEIVTFPSGLLGIAFNLDEEEVGVILLGDYQSLHAGDEVQRTGRVMDAVSYTHLDVYKRQMIESTAIYTFVVSMILIFANPFWNHFLSQAGGK